MEMSSFCFVILVLLYSIHDSPVYANQPCLVSGETCRPLKECPVKLDIINKLKRCGSSCVSPSEESSVRASICGFELRDPLVCCGLAPTPPVISVTTQNQAHISLRLLPDSEACGQTLSGDRIIGGEDARIGDSPSMVLLSGTDKRTGVFQHFCGGTLINARYVLTAAHCVSEDAIFQLTVLTVGENDLSKDPDRSTEGFIAPPVQKASPEAVITHPLYNKDCIHCNDIALIRLRQPVNIQKGFIDAICLPTNPVEQLQTRSRNGFVGREATAAGWGVTLQDDFGRIRRRNILQQVQIPVHDVTACSIYNITFPDPDSILCGGESGKDTCKGDSGGPLIIQSGSKQQYIIGITSLGPKKCASENFPAIYTKVSRYITWILDNLKP